MDYKKLRQSRTLSPREVNRPRMGGKGRSSRVASSSSSSYKTKPVSSLFKGPRKEKVLHQPQSPITTTIPETTITDGQKDTMALWCIRKQPKTFDKKYMDKAYMERVLAIWQKKKPINL